MAERIRVSGLAIVSALILFFVATGLFNAELQAGTGDDIRELTYFDVAALTIITSVLAIAVAAILDRGDSELRSTSRTELPRYLA